MTKTVNNIIATLFLVCLLFTVASAELVVIKTPFEQPDFSAFSSSSISSCACSSTIDYVVITNPLSLPQSFKISTDSSFISLPTGSLIVNAKSSLSVPYQINTPCNAKSDSFDIVVSGSKESKIISKDLTVLQCQNLKVEEPKQIVTDICKPFVSSFTLENTGEFTETYTIESKKYAEYVSFPSQSITLASGARSIVSFPYELSCEVVGEQELSYDISTKKSDLKASVTQKVIIPDTYDYSVQVNQVTDVCIGDENHFEILIENKNNFTDFFRVDVSADNYVTVQYPEFEGKKTKTIALAPFTQTTLDVVVTPSKERHVGAKQLSVLVTSKFAKTTQQATANYSVQHCYDLDNVFPTTVKSISMCGGELLVQEVELLHEGTGNPLIEVISSHDFVTFENNTVQFQGYQSENISLIFDIPHNMTSRETVTLSALFRNEIVGKTSFYVYIDTKENCYLISPIKDAVSFYEDADSFSLSVQNLGERSSVFTSETLFAPDYVQLLTEEFELAPGRRTNLEFKINQSLLGTAAQTFNNGSLIGLSGLTSLRLAPHNNFTQYDYDVQLSVVDYPWYVKLWNSFIGLNVCLIIFFILALLVIIFGIIGIIKTSRHEHFHSNNVLALIFLILFIIATIFVFMNFGVPLSPYTSHTTESNSTTHIIMVEDKSKTINLDEFFFDPDNNLVEFGVSSYDESVLEVSQERSSFTLTPEKDWFGTTSLVLFVTDAYNESAVSPEITVEILSVEDYSLFELFTLFCKYINLVVLFMLFLVIYVAFSFHPQPKEKQLTLAQAQNSKEDKPKISPSKKQAKKSPKKQSKKSSKKSAKKSSKKTSSSKK